MSQLDALEGFLMSLEPTDGREFALDQVKQIRVQFDILHKGIEGVSALDKPADVYTTSANKIYPYLAETYRNDTLVCVHDLRDEHESFFYASVCKNFGIDGLARPEVKTPDQPTQEPQEEAAAELASPLTAPIDEAVVYSGVEVVTNGDAETNSSGGVIGSFSDVSDEAVREAGGEPAPSDEAIAALRDVPDFGPTES